eukprot:tig00000806_g4337.t1
MPPSPSGPLAPLRRLAEELQATLDGPVGQRIRLAVQGAVAAAVVGVVLARVAQTTAQEPRAAALVGLAVSLGCACALSASLRAVRWGAVASGLLLQYSLAALWLPSAPQRAALDAVGAAARGFLSFADAGAQFVFGAAFHDFYFAFRVLPVVIYISACLSVACYVKLVPRLVSASAFVLRVWMGVPPELAHAAACPVFLNGADVAELHGPSLHRMSPVHLHALVAGAYTAPSVALWAVFIALGAPPGHVLLATLLSAAASATVHQLVCPAVADPPLLPPPATEGGTELEELKEGLAAGGAGVGAEPPPAVAAAAPWQPPAPLAAGVNVIDAASHGALRGLELCGAVGAPLLALLALLSLVDSILGSVGGWFGFPSLSLGTLLSYALYPLAWAVGVPPPDCRTVAELLGYRTVLNEIVSFGRLGAMGAGPTTLGPRSAALATHVLCGFCSLGALGLAPAALLAAADAARTKDGPEAAAAPQDPTLAPRVARAARRALLSALLARLLAASIAGTLL